MLTMSRTQHKIPLPWNGNIRVELSREATKIVCNRPFSNFFAEGTIQGDPIAMPLYAIGILPVMRQEQEVSKKKQCAFADDLAGTGMLLALKSWWDVVVYPGPFIDAKPSKSWLIVKPMYFCAVKLIFENSRLNSIYCKLSIKPPLSNKPPSRISPQSRKLYFTFLMLVHP